MTDIDFKRALTYVKLGDQANLKAFLSTINSDLRQFADMAFNKNVINKDGWKKIVGEPMPDLEKESAFMEFNARIQNGNFTFEELQTTYGDDRYNKTIKGYINKRLQDLSFNEFDLKEYFKRGVIDETQTRAYCKRANLDFDEIDQKPVPPINIPSHLWPTDPNLTYGNTDVLLIGSPSAGKTMLLASLFHYGKETLGKLNPDSANSGGFAYSSILISAVEQGQFITQTPPDTILHTTAYISSIAHKRTVFGKIKEETIISPFNFIEMPGETYLKAFGKGFDALPDNLKVCFEQSQNPKVVFFTIPVKEKFVKIGEGSNEMKILAQELYTFILDIFISSKIMDKIVAVGLIITKWDEHDSYTEEALDLLIDKKCKSLDDTLIRLDENSEITYESFPFWISPDVDVERNTYKFDSTHMKEIYDWLLEVAPIRP